MQWVEVLAALLTPTIALIAISIAWQQLKTNRDSVREKLFDRRWALFKKIQLAISNAYQKPEIEDEEMRILIGMKQEATFLFGDDVTLFLERVQEEVHVLRMLKMLDSVTKNEPPEAALQRSYKMDNQREVIRLELEELFRLMEPYISFKNNRDAS